MCDPKFNFDFLFLSNGVVGQYAATRGNSQLVPRLNFKYINVGFSGIKFNRRKCACLGRIVRHHRIVQPPAMEKELDW